MVILKKRSEKKVQCTYGNSSTTATVNKLDQCQVSSHNITIIRFFPAALDNSSNSKMYDQRTK